MNKLKNKPKLYICICKVANRPDGTAHCIRHHLSDLISYVRFLDKQFPGWRWFNVHANVGQQKGEQLASFTKHRRPTSNRL